MMCVQLQAGSSKKRHTNVTSLHSIASCSSNKNVYSRSLRMPQHFEALGLHITQSSYNLGPSGVVPANPISTPKYYSPYYWEPLNPKPDISPMYPYISHLNAQTQIWHNPHPPGRWPRSTSHFHPVLTHDLLVGGVGE